MGTLAYGHCGGAACTYTFAELQRRLADRDAQLAELRPMFHPLEGESTVDAAHRHLRQKNFKLAGLRDKVRNDTPIDETKCSCFCGCTDDTDGTCIICDECGHDCDPYERPW